MYLWQLPVPAATPSLFSIRLLAVAALGRTVREQTFAAAAQPQRLSVADLKPGIHQVRAPLSTGQLAAAVLQVQ
ncbi:hypothetical protein [Hymenobacter chitinivorans]|uniref:Uncharacterized protein n=1 Tax=Hymenobacter chitinivorans DSM 11115 TaxID=1121954 RepID=A0A2M9AQC0_9BACT|nr:hypothetical protein [Hymenobacter chitinivorans]PJJ47889.1 hypothetical protein CLV45_4579 [Hymenobacter chitinivorans DSM 11115]